MTMLVVECPLRLFFVPPPPPTKPPPAKWLAGRSARDLAALPEIVIGVEEPAFFLG
jgi:hypothetical protein